MTPESRHLSVWIDRPASEVYQYACDPASLAEWAPGLGPSVEQVGGQWFVDTPEGRAGLSFAPRNAYGVLDHHVSLPSGDVVYVPLRVIPDGAGDRRCEVVFSLRRQPGMTDAEFDRDADAVSADLARLREIAEKR